MENIDVLGFRPERHAAFTPDLLAETQDAALQQIVEQAARELSTPIALVTLVLDQIQFFKAHHGLPPDLAAACGTRRDVSFCQFVVRDEQPFEVTDARVDTRVPQHLVQEYGIRAYLGVPIRAGETVLGSLCVLDTKARSFSEEDRATLAELAASVEARMEALRADGRRAGAFAGKVAGPALVELRQSLNPVAGFVEAGLPAVAAIRSFIRLSEYVLAGGSTSPEVMRRSLDAAAEAIEASEDGLQDILMAARDCEDCLLALEHLTTAAPSTRLSEVLIAAQDLARQVTRPIGGARLLDLPCDPFVSTARPLAVALLTTSLTMAASSLARLGVSGGIRMQLQDLGSTAELSIFAEGLSDRLTEEIAAELSEQIGNDPSVRVQGGGDAVRLAFLVAEPDDRA